MVTEVLAAVPTCAKRANVEMTNVDTWTFGAERLDSESIALIGAAARRLEVPTLDIASQAGHDACHVSKVAPTAMIFTPCREGVTHKNRERAEQSYTVPGVNVRSHAVVARANR